MKPRYSIIIIIIIIIPNNIYSHKWSQYHTKHDISGGTRKS
jgi:hypothetical protein